MALFYSRGGLAWLEFGRLLSALCCFKVASLGIELQCEAEGLKMRPSEEDEALSIFLRCVNATLAASTVLK
ncbi:hypothetical protein BDW68DRAFT_158396 [Aspergillus falconensis]